MQSPRSVSLRTGHRPAGTGASCARVALLIPLAALALGGCGTAAPLANSGLISAFAAQPPPRAVLPPVEVEDDGVEAQRPPRLRMYGRPDDPTQPFSPNYGEIPLPQQPDDGEESPPAPA
jgi:hypothetical protein